MARADRVAEQYRRESRHRGMWLLSGLRFAILPGIAACREQDRGSYFVRIVTVSAILIASLLVIGVDPNAAPPTINGAWVLSEH